MSKGGEIEIRVWREGYPVWCELYYGGRALAKLRHSELSDLRYAAEKAMQEARNALPDTYRNEV